MSLGKGGFGWLSRESPPKTHDFQLGFMTFIIAPLYNSIAKIPGVDLSECLAQMEANMRHWDDLKQQANGK
jgi:hypothetical protein